MTTASKTPTRETVLILRTCKADCSSQNNFVWPESGYVEAPDWQATKACGNGLHGWLKGQGDPSLGYQDQEGALGQVVETYADRVIDLNGKCKYPGGWVIYTGELHKAANIVKERYPDVAVLFATATAGYHGTATAGYHGTATAGDGGTATAGYYGTATAGEEGLLLIQRWNGKRYRYEVANVGEDGILPNVAYKLDDDGKFVMANPKE